MVSGFWWTAAAVALVTAQNATLAQTGAQTAVQPAPLTLERVFASPALTGARPRVLKLSPDGRLATLLQNRPDDRARFDLWAGPQPKLRLSSVQEKHRGMEIEASAPT